MKWDFLQSDMGQGEIDPRARGQIGTDLYRASFSRAANVVPTLERAVCSRAGGRLIPRIRPDDGVTGNGDSVRLFGLTNGPIPGQAIETDWTPAGPTQVTRIFDKRGAVSIHEPFVLTPWTLANAFFLAVTSQYDSDDDALYLRPNDTATSPQFALGVGPPATTGDFTLEFKYAGGPVRLTVSDPTGVTVWYQHTFNAATPADNVQSVTFTPAGAFILKWDFAVLNGPSVRISKMLLRKDKMKFLIAGGGGAQFAPTGCETFWKGGSYYVIMWDQISAPVGFVYTPPAVPGDRTVAVWRAWNPAFATFVPGAITKYQNRLWFAANDGSGRVLATKVGYGAGAGVALALDFTIHAPPLATDGLDLNIAGTRVNWMRPLRGLMIGALTSETQFVQLNGGALTLDPAAGLAFDVIDHSTYGSDSALPALGYEDQILFSARGRQKFKAGSLRFQTQGGFRADDFSLYGEHLLNARVRFYCVLISPIQRVVFVMDDGTGAIATVTPKGIAWTRFTHWQKWAWCANVETPGGSELWMVDKALGQIMRFTSLDSKTPPTKTSWNQLFLTPAVAPDYNPPPIMDDWVRVGIGIDVNGKPVPLNTAEYASLVNTTGGNAGTRAHVVTVQGQYLGTYDLGTESGQPTFVPPPVLAGLAPTYVDAGGNKLPQEVFIGIAYPEHRVTSLPLEGGNPAGTAQAHMSRKPGLYLRLVDSYLPLVNGKRSPERQPGDSLDLLASRVTDDVRYTELGFHRGAVVDISQDVPLRFEVSAMFGGTQTQNANA